jgi:hypothetical protein
MRVMKDYIEKKIQELEKELEYFVSICDKEKGEFAKGQIKAYNDILKKIIE